MKIKSLLLALLLGISLLVGCGSGEEPVVEDPSTKQEENSDNVDVTSSASMANDVDSLKNALKESWIITFKSDIVSEEDIVVEGDFEKPSSDDANVMVATGRKLALYDQDADRNKTATYTLTAPKLIIKSKDTKIQGGTFVGDVYVEADGFVVKDAKVDGNVYFSKEEYKDSFVLESDGTITGVQEVQ